jgi:hypothetical protein
MSLENKLAENMIRFGVKNLSEHSNQKLTVLSEQLKVKWKKGKFKFWGSSGTIQQTVDPLTYMEDIETPKDEWDQYLTDYEQPMMQRMNSTSVTHWEEIKSKPETKGYAVASLEQWIKTFPKSKWKYVIVDSEAGIKEIIDRIPKINPTPEAADGNGISVATKFPLNGPSSNFFKNNEWEVTDAFKTMFQTEIIDPIQAGMAMMKFNAKDANAPKYACDVIQIATSCSRLVNGGLAAGLTFKGLSKKRNDAALKYIRETLTSIGVLIAKDITIVQSIDGRNGDGSSGPNPPRTDRQGNSYGIPRSGKANDWNKDEDTRNDFGDPSRTIEDYLKFKYCVAGIQLIVNRDWTDKPLPEEDQTDVPQWEDIIIQVPTTNYLVYFMSPWRKFGLKIKIPHPVFSWRIPPKQFGFDSKFWKKAGTICPLLS